MTAPSPAAGKTHHCLIRWNNDANDLGLMLPDLKLYSSQPYSPFAPQSREGEASIKDFSILATWELGQDWSGGVGQLKEPKVETNKYALAVGTPALYTAHPGRIMPPPAEYAAGTSTKTIKQFIEFNGAYYALTNATAGTIFKYNATGETLGSAVETLTAAGKQLYHDGSTLYATQGASNVVRITTDGTTWSNHTFNADFVAMRDDNALAYVAGGTFTPAGTEGYPAMTVGWTGTTATNMQYYKGACWIGKPEGLFSWARGAMEDRLLVHDEYSTSNFVHMVVHKDLLFFNIGNRLLYTDGKEFQEIFPDDPNGFTQIDSLAGSFGPLIIGARMDMDTSDAVTAYYAGLFTYDGPDRPNLNPLYMSSLQSVTSSAKSPGTIANDTSAGTVAWSDPTNAGASDNSYAVASMPLSTPVSSLSNYLKCSNFGFAIPTGAVITGVVATIEWKIDSVGLGRLNVSVFESAASADAGPITQYIADDARATEGSDTLGSSTDLWGLDLTAADVNSSNFGVSVVAEHLGGARVYSVDHVQLTVYYYAPYSFIGAGTTSLFDATGKRLYFCESSTKGTNHLDLTARYEPKSYTTETAKDAYIQLTEFASGFRALKKWYHVCVLSVDNPNSTTYAELWYSADKGAWTQTTDEAGSVVTLTLNSNLKAVFFPLNTSASQIELRLYVWTTDSGAAAHVTHVTLRGMVWVKPRRQISFPVDCGETVLNLAGVKESGTAIRDLLYDIADQTYPFKLQDPWGDWHLCVMRPPSPMDTIKAVVTPQGYTPERLFTVVNLVLMELDPLSSTGARNAWTPS